MFSISYSRKASLFIACALFSSGAWYASPANADASLDELKAKLEKAEKENIVLKTEKVERENITMKLEKIEAENAALRNEAKIDKTPTNSIPAQKTAAVPANTPSPEAKTVARRESVETSMPAPREHVAAQREINDALDNIPKDDVRREMTAAYKPTKEEVPVLVKQWQGIYAGINAGYGLNDINTYYTSIGLSPNYNYSTYLNLPTVGAGGSRNYYGGPLVGGQFGYNYEFNNHSVLGAEIDLNWADINNNYVNSPGNWGFQSSGGQTIVSSNNSRTGLDWIGTARVRLGYSLGNFMPYLTGGLAYGQLSVKSSSVSYNSMAYATPTYFSNAANGIAGGNAASSVNAGWVLGAGAEYFVAKNWSVKGEYLYTQISGLGQQTLSSLALSQSSSYGPNYTGTSPTLTYITMGTFGIHQARVGLNYHTGWLGSGGQAVTAKY